MGPNTLALPANDVRWRDYLNDLVGFSPTTVSHAAAQTLPSINFQSVLAPSVQSYLSMNRYISAFVGRSLYCSTCMMNGGFLSSGSGVIQILTMFHSFPSAGFRPRLASIHQA